MYNTNERMHPFSNTMIQMMNFTMWWRNGKVRAGKEPADISDRSWQHKCAELEHALKRSQERYLCLANAIALHNRPIWYELKSTSKDIPVLLCTDAEGWTIELYNLNNNPDAKLILKLTGLCVGREASIVHIGGGVRLGHGQLAVEHFVKLCREKSISKINTRFVAKDKETEKELLGFFSKCGFSVVAQVGMIWDMAYSVE